MDILFIHSCPLWPISGENIRPLYILDLLAKQGHNIDLVAPESKITFPKEIRFFPSGKIERFVTKKTFLNTREIQHLIFGLKSLRLFKKLKNKYDLVYCFGIAGSLLANKFSRRCPIFVDYYEVDFPELRDPRNLIIKTILKFAEIWNRFFLRKAYRVFVLTKAIKTFLRERYNLDSIVVYDGADEQLFNQKIKKKHAGFNLIFHGGIEKRDNLLIVLKALKQLKEYNFKFIIIGDGLAKRECESFAAKYLRNKVLFTGWVEYRKIPSYLSKADLALMPRKNIRINNMVIPRKTFEYINSGVPILTTDLPVIREVLSPADSVLIKKPEVKEIKNALRFYFNNKKLLKEKSKKLMKKKVTLQSECKKIYTEIENIKKFKQ